MTEQGIIAYLKENKTRGVVFGLFPKDVQNWCRKHRDKNIFEYFRFDGIWAGLIKLCPRSDTAYCLKSDYIPEIGFKEHWQEFEIDKDGHGLDATDSRFGVMRVSRRWSIADLLSLLADISMVSGYICLSELKGGIENGNQKRNYRRGQASYRAARLPHNRHRYKS